jgi:4-methyl-5(b-hydroxyethyl)-thiazole monophosphate biosynthesis
MNTTPSVLAILMHGFEEIEAIAPIDLLRRAGVRVVVASLAHELAVTGRCGVTVLAETTLTEASKHSYDLVFLPGGPGVKHLRADPRIVPLVQAQVAAGRPVAAICAAPTVLLDAGLLAGRRYTAFPGTANELPHLLADQRVVEDGLILTSRGAGTALDLGYALIARLLSPAKAAEIKQSICA